MISSRDEIRSIRFGNGMSFQFDFIWGGSKGKTGKLRRRLLREAGKTGKINRWRRRGLKGRLGKKGSRIRRGWTLVKGALEGDE